jgi:hypothetical protein
MTQGTSASIMYKIDVGSLAVIEKFYLERFAELRSADPGLLVFSLDGNYMTQFTHTWDVVTGRLVKNKPGMAFLAGGKKYEINASGKAQLITPPAAITGSLIGWLRDGVRVLTKENYLYQIWNTQTLEKEHQFPIYFLFVGESINCLAVSPDGRYMLCAIDQEQMIYAKLRVYDLNFHKK